MIFDTQYSSLTWRETKDEKGKATKLVLCVEPYDERREQLQIEFTQRETYEQFYKFLESANAKVMLEMKPLCFGEPCPFPECPEKFSAKSALKAHKKEVHAY